MIFKYIFIIFFLSRKIITEEILYLLLFFYSCNFYTFLSKKTKNKPVTPNLNTTEN